LPKSTGIPLARPLKVPPAPDGFTAAKPNEWLPIWDRVITTTPTKAVGYAVARFAGWDNGGNIRPGNAILGRMCSCSDKSVRVALGQMREWGLLWRYHKGTRQGDADVYRLTFPDDALARIPLLDPDWELPVPPTGAVGATAPVALTAAVAEAVAAVGGTGALRYQLPPTSTETSTGSLHDDGEGFDLAGAEVAHAREVKIPMDAPGDFEAVKQRKMREFEAWMQEHPEAS
jgi:hypothetical protein